MELFILLLFTSAISLVVEGASSVACWTSNTALSSCILDHSDFCSKPPGDCPCSKMRALTDCYKTLCPTDGVPGGALATLTLICSPGVDPAGTATDTRGTTGRRRTSADSVSVTQTASPGTGNVVVTPAATTAAAAGSVTGTGTVATSASKAGVQALGVDDRLKTGLGLGGLGALLLGVGALL